MENIPHKDWWNLESNDILNILNSKKSGISQVEAKRRLKIYGYNEISSKNSISALKVFISQFKNWLTGVLVLAAIVSFFLKAHVDSVVIIVLVVVSGVFGFIQEYKAEQTLSKLKKFIKNKTSAYRDGRLTKIDSKKVVPGDIIKLRIGDIVPADIRLISSDSLLTNESVLTGESIPIEKTSEILQKTDILISEMKNMLFMGSSISQGTCIGIVVKTSKNTEFGKIAESIKEPATKTDFQEQISNFSRFLFKVIMLMTIFIFLANVVLNKGPFDSFLFAVALAVGIAPEMLPAILTVTLSQGAIRMAKKKVIVKRLMSVEDFGNIDTLCMDKTGTITEGRFTLHDYIDLDEKRNENLMRYALLCTSGILNKEKGKSNPTDRAIWESIFAQSYKNDILKFKVTDENEFDFERQRMSVVVNGNGKKLLICKGSCESVLDVSKYYVHDNKKWLLNDIKRNKLIKQVENYESQGFRVIALSFKKYKDNVSSFVSEKNLEILGFLLFKDPIKDTTISAIEKFINLGIDIKVISGDSLIVTKSIAREVGIKFTDEQIITGDKLKNINDEKFFDLVKENVVFSRITPEQKYRIIKALNYEGHIVGYLGDGVNDVPALREADVGITVDSGSDIAKEASDIILLEKDLKVLVEGIETGRKTYGNIMKYILNTISANYGNMFTVAISSLFLKFIPLLPSQILLNNFISDIPMFAIATDNVDEGFTKKPNKWNLTYIKNFMISYGFVSTIFDMGLILPMIFIFNVPKEVFWTAWFIESSISEMLVTFTIRTKLPFYRSKPSKILLLLSVFATLFVIAITMVGVGRDYFSFTQLPYYIWLLIIIDLIAYFTVTEIVKKKFFQRLESK